MSSAAEPPTPTPATVTAARFDRDGETVYNLTLRVTDSPGAAWHATVAAFSATAERIPADAPAGLDERDLLLMGCWHARQMLGQIEANPEYAAQLRAHDEANVPMASLQASVVKANRVLPVDQREILALRGLSRLDHNDLATLLRADPSVLAAVLAQARLMLRDAMRGSSIASEALTTPEARQAIALAALRQDGQLRGAEARLTLARWLEGGDERRSVVDALEEAGLSYRAWTRTAAPEGLREAVVAAAAQVQAPAPSAPTAEPEAAAPAASPAPAAVDPSPVAPAATPEPVTGEPLAPAPADDPAPLEEPTAITPGPAPVGPADDGLAPAQPVGPGGEPVDPDATVEWSSAEVAALGLAQDEAVHRDVPQPSHPEHVTDEDDEHLEDGGSWDDDDWDDHEGPLVAERLQPIEPRRRAPRWQVLVLGILLFALLVVLALTFLGGDDDGPTPTTPSTDESALQVPGVATAAATTHTIIVVRG